ncbi:MAG: flotillin-like FloA family protein [Verrucomicrobiota bacterium]
MDTVLPWLILAGLVALAPVALYFGYLWLRARLAGARVPFQDLVFLRLRGFSAKQLVDALIFARLSELEVTSQQLEVHLLYGGNLRRAVTAMAMEAKQGGDLTFREASALDLMAPPEVENLLEFKKEHDKARD